jgi:hypothetical protein
MAGTTADLDLNGKTIDLSSNGTITGESNDDRIFGLTGFITATRNISNVNGLDVGGMGLVLTTAANMGSTVFTRAHSDYSNGTYSTILRNYSISPTNNSNLDASIIFNYFDKELNGLSTKETNFVLLRSTNSGLSWTNRAGIISAAANNISLSSISAFSLWTVAASSGTALPIELISFEAKSIDEKVLLLWKTASEENNDYFTVQRSFDGVHFSPLKRVYSNGNSKVEKNYSLIDEEYVNGINYYKLIQTDLNGEEEVFDIVAIDMFKEKSILMKTINSLGQVVDANYKGVVYDVYSDGTSKTRIQ